MTENSEPAGSQHESLRYKAGGGHLVAAGALNVVVICLLLLLSPAATLSLLISIGEIIVSDAHLLASGGLIIWITTNGVVPVVFAVGLLATAEIFYGWRAIRGHSRNQYLVVSAVGSLSPLVLPFHLAALVLLYPTRSDAHKGRTG